MVICAKMKTKNELFMDAIEWLIDNGLAENQGDIAVKAGLGPNLISRIKNGHVKSVSDDAIRALCDRFRELNIEYLRGKSDCISRQQSADKVLAESRLLLEANTPHEPARHSAIDDCLMYEKAINKIISPMYQEKIALLENQLTEKDKHIATLHELMDALKRENAMLREQLSKYQADEVIGRHPFPLGSAEPESKEHPLL